MLPLYLQCDVRSAFFIFGYSRFPCAFRVFQGFFSLSHANIGAIIARTIDKMMTAQITAITILLLFSFMVFRFQSCLKSSVSPSVIFGKDTAPITVLPIRGRGKGTPVPSD